VVHGFAQGLVVIAHLFLQLGIAEVGFEGAAAPLPSREAESQVAEGDLIAGADGDGTIDAPAVEAGPVGRPEIDEQPLPALAAKLGVVAGDRGSRKHEIARFGTADREHAVVDLGEREPRQARFVPGGLEPYREGGEGGGGVGQATRDPSLWRQVVDQRGELVAAPSVERPIDTPYERVERELPLSGTLTKRPDRPLPVRI
jgi:hypothetical protein